MGMSSLLIIADSDSGTSEMNKATGVFIVTWDCTIQISDLTSLLV